MKIAVWRYTLPLNGPGQSDVGGGRITRHVLEALMKLGSVTALGKTNKDAIPELTAMGLKFDPDGDPSNYDLTVILTGPANPMYGGFKETYDRLEGYTGKALYLQWDNALPFHFRPAPFKGQKIPHPTNAQWSLLTQCPESQVRASRRKTVGYHDEPFEVVPCMFELVELQRPDYFRPHESPIPAVGYFGSGRPARITQLKKWFTHPDSPPVHVFGKWSKGAREQVSAPNVHFQGPIPEADVAKTLNTYACTFYVTDPAYVKQDYITQRFFENGVAGVPVAYSNRLQVSVHRAISEAFKDEWVMEGPRQLSRFFAGCLDQAARGERSQQVKDHRAVIASLTKYKKMDGIRAALEKVLR